MLSMEGNQMSVVHYDQVITIMENCIVIRMNGYNLQIRGSSLHVDALEKEELLLEGRIQQITFLYDE